MLHGLRPAFALAAVADPAWIAAALPLMRAGLVEALEWNPDERWRGIPELPALSALIATFAQAGALCAHAVAGSLGTVGREERFADWLAAVVMACRAQRPRWCTEHLGWMAADAWDHGAPLPLPRCRASTALVQERLRRLADAVEAPVGLENLAFAFTAQQAWDDGPWLDELLAPSGGLMVLDLHNLWCQAVNLGLDPLALLERQPLQRVRELHVSGGSWWRAGARRRRVRRDTHDGGLPGAVLDLLAAALRRCPQVEVVVLERLPVALRSAAQRRSLRRDAHRVRAIIAAAGAASVAPAPPVAAAAVAGPTAEALAHAQGVLLAAMTGPRGGPLRIGAEADAVWNHATWDADIAAAAAAAARTWARPLRSTR